MLVSISFPKMPSEISKNLSSFLLQTNASNLKRKRDYIRLSAMKSLTEIKALLKELKPTLKEKYQVETIGVFGSYSREEQEKRSDVDILVTFTEPNDIDLIDFIEVKQYLSRKLGVKVDLVKKSALKNLIRDKILEETVYI